MRSKIVAVTLALLTIILPPGGGLALFASTISYEYDLRNNVATPYIDNSDNNGSAGIDFASDKLINEINNNKALNANVSGEDLNQAKSFIKRYPQSAVALDNVAAEIKNGSVEPGLAIADLYDKLAQSAGKIDKNESEAYVMHLADGKRVLIHSRALGVDTRMEESHKYGAGQTITYGWVLDPKNPEQKLMDSIALVKHEGAAQIQHPVYSRQLNIFLEKLYTAYYVQPDLMSKIKAADPKSQKKLLATFNKNQREFLEHAGELRDYIKHINDVERESVDHDLTKHKWQESDYELLKHVSQVADNFAADKQADWQSKKALALITQYLSLETNAQPIQPKDGLEEAGLAAQNLKKLKGILDTLQNGGHLSGYGVLNNLGATKITRDYWRQSISNEAAAAMADIGYAVEHAKDVQKALDAQKAANGPKNFEEAQALIEAKKGWLNLANEKLTVLQMQNMAIGLGKLKDGDMRENMGLDRQDMRDEAATLLKADPQYFTRLEALAKDSKANLLKRSVADFDLTAHNVKLADLYGDAMRDRINTLAAKSDEMKDLYLSSEFDKVGESSLKADQQKYEGSDEMSALRGNPYKNFLDHLSAKQTKESQGFDDLSARLRQLATSTGNPNQVRQSIDSIMADFMALVKQLGPEYAHIPDMDDVSKEGKVLDLRQEKLFGAVQEYTSHVNLFEQINQTDSQLRQQASVQTVSSAKMPWYDQIFNMRIISHMENLATVGYYDPVANFGVEHVMPYVQWAASLVGADFTWNPTLYHNFVVEHKYKNELYADMAHNDFKAVEATLVKMDEDGAKNADKQYEATKGPEDKYADFDFDRSLSKSKTDMDALKADGVMTDLGNQAKAMILGYDGVSMFLDWGIMSVATLGLEIPMVAGAKLSQGFAGFARNLRATGTAEETAAAMEAAEQAAKAGTEVAKADAAINDLSAMSRFGAKMSDLGSDIFNSWATNIKNHLGMEHLNLNDPILKIGYEMYRPANVRQAFTSAFRAYRGSTLTMGLISAGQMSYDYWRHPETAAANGYWDALLQGGLRGAKFGAQAGMVFMIMPFQAYAFKTDGFLGRWVLGRPLRALADSQGPASAIARVAAKTIAPESAIGKAVIDGGLWGSAFGWLDSPALKAATIQATTAEEYFPTLKPLGKILGRGLVRTGIQYGAMTDGLIKFIGYTSVFTQVSLLGAHYHPIQKAEAFLGVSSPNANVPAEKSGSELAGIEPATPQMRNMVQAQAEGDFWMQAGFFLMPNGIVRSPKEMAAQMDQSRAFKALVNNGQTMDIEDANNDATIQVPIPPSQRTWSELAKNAWEIVRDGGVTAPVVSFRVSENSRQTAARLRMQGTKSFMDYVRTPAEKKGFSPAELLSVISAPGADVLGRTLEFSDLKSLLSSKATQEERVEAYKKLNVLAHLSDSSMRYTDDIAGASRDELKAWLRGNKVQRAAILAAGDEYRMPDSNGKTTLVAGQALKSLKDLAQVEEVNLGQSGIWQRAKRVFGLQRMWTVVGEPTIDPYDNLVARVQSNLKGSTSDELIKSADDAMGKEIAKITKRGASGWESDVQALQGQASVIKSKAYIRYVAQIMAKDFGKEPSAEAKAQIELFEEVWSKGFFGQRVEVGKDAEGKPIYERPADFDAVHDALEHDIPDLKTGQKMSIKDVLTAMANGHKSIFLQLATGGGKTLTAFVLIEYLDAHARLNGRKGVLYVVPDGNLKVQVQDAYRAFFRGRETPFEVITEDELKLRVAMAKVSGGVNPFVEYHVIVDEGDLDGLRSALSLGSPTGWFSFPRLASPMRTILKDYFTQAKEYAQARYPSRDFDQTTIDEAIKKDPDMAKKLNELRDQATEKLQAAFDDMRSDAFKRKVLNIHSDLYKGLDIKTREDYVKRFRMEPEQVYKTMQKEMKNAFGAMYEPNWMRKTPLKAFAKVGVLERQFGTLDRWVEYGLKGSLIVGSFNPATESKKYAKEAVDPSRADDELMQYFNDVPLAALDTGGVRTALEVLNHKIINLPYDNLYVVDHAGMIVAAKEGGGYMVRMSGTLGKELKKFYQKMGMLILGEPSKPAKLTYELPPKGTNALDLLFNNMQKDAEINQSGAQKVLSVAYLPTKDAQAYIEKKIKAFENDKINNPTGRKIRTAVLVTPDSNLQIQERMMYWVQEAKNLAALKNGEVDAVFFVGSQGLRGLDAPWGAYGKKPAMAKGGDMDLVGALGKNMQKGRMEFYVMDPPNPELPVDLSMTSLTQLVGRAAEGRLPKMADGKTLAIDVNFRGIIPDGYLGKTAAYRDGVLAKALKDALNPSGVSTFKSSPELGRLLSRDEIEQALKDPAKLSALAERRDVAGVMIGSGEMNRFMNAQREKAERRDLGASGIFNRSNFALPVRAMIYDKLSVAWNWIGNIKNKILKLNPLGAPMGSPVPAMP